MPESPLAVAGTCAGSVLTGANSSRQYDDAVSLSVLSWPESLSASLLSIGGKAANLARLTREEFPVPEFFVVPSEALSLHLEGNALAWPGSMDPGIDREGLLRVGASIQAVAVPPALSRSVVSAYEDLCETSGRPVVAVRSSGAEEDSQAASFAGQFSSFLGVHGPEAVLGALKECWASYLSPRSLDYRAERGIALAEAPRLGVVIQVQLLSDKAGVLFTEHPLDPGGDSAAIEANFGTGDSVAGGLATPDTITISRSSGEVVDVHSSTKRRTPVLSDCEARAVLHLGLRVEQLLGGPQDIEWAFENGRLWVLQARPITSVSPIRN